MQCEQNQTNKKNKTNIPNVWTVLCTQLTAVHTLNRSSYSLTVTRLIFFVCFIVGHSNAHNFVFLYIFCLLAFCCHLPRVLIFHFLSIHVPIMHKCIPTHTYSCHISVAKNCKIFLHSIDRLSDFQVDASSHDWLCMDVPHECVKVYAFDARWYRFIK